MNTIVLIWIGLLGLCIGSFLNVVIYRLPRKLPLARSRSVCPGCGRQLQWYHNIPLLSVVLLRGRCAFCRDKISLRYPLVELLNGLTYCYFFSYYGLSFSFVTHALLVSILIVIFFIDLDYYIIPDSITLPGIVLALGVSFLPGGIGIISSAIGLLVGGGSLFLIALLGDWLFKKESMGGGDIKMAAMLGAFLGWKQVLFIFISSAVIGLVVSLGMMMFSAKLRQSRMIPFGPFLALAAVAAMIYGSQVIEFYVSHVVGIPAVGVAP